MTENNMKIGDRVCILCDDDIVQRGTLIGQAIIHTDLSGNVEELSPVEMYHVVHLDYMHQGYVYRDDTGCCGPEDITKTEQFVTTTVVHPDNLRPAVWYVNVYREGQVYVSPAEGGTYSYYREIVESNEYLFYRDREYAEHAANLAREEYSDDDDVRVCIEDHPAVAINPSNHYC